MCVCVCVCARVKGRIDEISEDWRLSTNIHTHVHKHARMHKHTYTHSQVRDTTYMHAPPPPPLTRTLTHTHTHTLTHIHTHTRMHHLQSCNPEPLSGRVSFPSNSGFSHQEGLQRSNVQQHSNLVSSAQRSRWEMVL